jgi:hypothetical protein
MKAQLDMILDIIDKEDEYKIIFKNKKCKLPTAEIYPNKEVESKPGSTLIVITANKPALIRYALCMLVNHEKTHHLFMKDNPNFTGDHHKNPVFQMYERFFNNEIDSLIEEEHG